MPRYQNHIEIVLAMKKWVDQRVYQVGVALHNLESAQIPDNRIYQE
jgi:hypothetical protein